jgi:ketosteroid isomerase-like protein
MPTADFEDFLKQRDAASNAFVEGDFAALEKISTHHSPATLFGPNGDCIQGAAEVNAANAKSARMFRPGSTNAFEVMDKAAGDEFAYWVGLQRSVVKVAGRDSGVPFNLRLTEIFRREDGQWKLIHRHADKLAEESA